MSREARDWAWQQPVKNSNKLVLLALAEYADAEGYCFPGRTTISDKTRLHKSTVTVALAALENDGYIERGRRARGNGSRTSDGCTLHLGRNSRPSQGRVSLHPRSQFPSTKVGNHDPHNRKGNQLPEPEPTTTTRTEGERALARAVGRAGEGTSTDVVEADFSNDTTTPTLPEVDSRSLVGELAAVMSADSKGGVKEGVSKPRPDLFWAKGRRRRAA